MYVCTSLRLYVHESVKCPYPLISSFVVSAALAILSLICRYLHILGYLFLVLSSLNLADCINEWMHEIRSHSTAANQA